MSADGPGVGVSESLSWSDSGMTHSSPAAAEFPWLQVHPTPIPHTQQGNETM